MGQQVRVDRVLKIGGYANTVPNIEGVLMSKGVYLDDHFTDAAITVWSQEEDNGGTIAYSAVLGGAVTMTTDGSDNGCAELYGPVIWSASKNCGMEAKIKLNTITLAGINVGFVDGYHNTNDQINFEITAGAATLVNARATNGAAFVFDTDGTPDVWYCAAVNADTEGTPVAAIGTLAPVANTYARLRVQLDTAGNATFYYNGVAVGYLPGCLAYASTDLLTPYIGFIERSASARILTVDRLTVWQDD